MANEVMQWSQHAQKCNKFHLMKVSDFFYPPLCLHCDEFVSEKSLLCEACAPFFDPLKPLERCFFCFKESQKRKCNECRKKKKSKIPLAAVWEPFGPVSSFIGKILTDPNPAFIKTATAFLALQFSKLNFPEPNLITTVPQYFLTRLTKGSHPQTLLAKSLSKTLSIPFKQTLFKTPLTNQYRLKKNLDIENKNILIVDIFISSERMNQLTESLLDGDPNKVYGLGLAFVE